MESNGSANTDAAPAVQTRCLAAADCFRMSSANNQAAPSATVLLNATPMKNENQVISFQPDILFTLPISLHDFQMICYRQGATTSCVCGDADFPPASSTTLSTQV